MQILDKTETLNEKEKLIKEIKSGAVFIYPTDTIYGLGCNALDDLAVRRIRDLKNRQKQPFSVIAPNKEWIKKNCKVEFYYKWLNKLPGPYTFIFKVNKKAVSSLVNPNLNTLGVRIPNHWFTEFVQLTQLPIVTTSVNKTSESYMTSLDDLDEDIKRSVDYIFYEGKIIGKPSKLVIFDKKPVVKER